MSDNLIKDKDLSMWTLSAWIESLVITVIFILLSEIVHDPLSLKSPYPWIWFAPVLIALHYGLLPSQGSIFVLVMTYLYVHPQQLFTTYFQLFVLGGFVMTFICSIWQNSWSSKIIYSNEISTYLQKRIQTIADTFRLTSLAYQRLENNYVAKPVTIRTSMNELRYLLANKNKDSEQQILNRFLNILAIHCSLEKAAIFPVINNKIIPDAITSIGSTKNPTPNNFFIKQCLENAKMTYITADEALKGHLTEYLIGAPFKDQSGGINALLLVEEMPFLSLNDENIATMNLLLNYFLEGNTVKGAEYTLHKFPDCPIVFANELQRLFNLEKRIQKDSAIEVFFILNKLREDDYIFRIKQEIRGLDSWWQTEHRGTKILMILMPFTDRPAAECYRRRIDEVLFQEFGIHINQGEIIFHSFQLSSFGAPITLIEEILRIK